MVQRLGQKSLTAISRGRLAPPATHSNRITRSDSMNIRHLIVGLAAAGLALAAAAQQPLKIKFSHVVAKDTPKG